MSEATAILRIRLVDCVQRWLHECDSGIIPYCQWHYNMVYEAIYVGEICVWSSESGYCDESIEADGPSLELIKQAYCCEIGELAKILPGEKADG